jgi:hypothetical protein
VFARYAVKPKHAYFLGTSTGGRDAMSYIQRWPLDYDGVIANEPALNYTGTRLSNVAVSRALYGKWRARLAEPDEDAAGAEDRDGRLRQARRRGRRHREQRGKLPPAQHADLASAGLPGRCWTRAPPACRDEQLATGARHRRPAELHDLQRWPTACSARAATTSSKARWWPAPSPRATWARPARNPARDANVFVTGDQWAKYFVTRNASFDSVTWTRSTPAPTSRA